MKMTNLVKESWKDSVKARNKFCCNGKETLRDKALGDCDGYFSWL